MPDYPNMLDREASLEFIPILDADLMNNWLNYGSGWSSFEYAKDTSGTVFLKGLIKDGTLTGSGDSTVFRLPVGYRPTETRLFTISYWDAAAPTQLKHGRVDVEPDGDIRLRGLTSNDWVSLEQLAFAAA